MSMNEIEETSYLHTHRLMVVFVVLLLTLLLAGLLWYTINQRRMPENRMEVLPLDTYTILNPDYSFNPAMHSMPAEKPSLLKQALYDRYPNEISQPLEWLSRPAPTITPQN
ncbi:MAG: hypothetical protein HPY45_15750 [Anaerolineae bacterium]|nr:hypothetical protein [Anaerolineae bacterium]